MSERTSSGFQSFKCFSLLQCMPCIAVSGRELRQLGGFGDSQALSQAVSNSGQVTTLNRGRMLRAPAGATFHFCNQKNFQGETA